MFFVPSIFVQYLFSLPVKLPLDELTVLCHIKYALISYLMDMQAWSNYNMRESVPG